jgi:hypothetical protein
MSDYYDRQGKPMTLEAWMKSFDDWNLKRVARDRIGVAEVSTVWLGLNHRFSMEGPPLIFETMIFGGDDNDFCKRYSTEDEALAGHKFVCDAIRAGHPAAEQRPQTLRDDVMGAILSAEAPSAAAAEVKWRIAQSVAALLDQRGVE